VNNESAIQEPLLKGMLLSKYEGIE